MKIFYSHKAVEQLEAFPLSLQERIIGKMIFFGMQSDPLRFADYIATDKEYRFRIGDYRVRFVITENVIIVRTIRRRDRAYD